MIVVDKYVVSMLSHKKDFRKSFRKNKSIIPYLQMIIDYMESHRGYLFDSLLYIGHTEDDFCFVVDVDTNNPITVNNCVTISFPTLLHLLKNTNKEGKQKEQISEEDLELWLTKSRLLGFNMAMQKNAVIDAGIYEDKYFVKEVIQEQTYSKGLFIISMSAVVINIAVAILRMVGIL